MNYEYVPAGELGPVMRGDLLDMHDSRRKVAGEPLRVVHVGKTHLRTACGRRWTLDRGEWIAAFHGGKPEKYSFPWVSKHAAEAG